MNEKQSRWTPEFKREYSRLYMQRLYNDNRLEAQKIKNTNQAKHKYYIPDDVINKYGTNTSHIIKLKKLVSELPAGVFSDFLNDFESLNFELK